MTPTATAAIACNLCDHDQVSVLSTRSRSGAPLRSVCCLQCGLSWSDPRPHDARTFYEDEYRVAYKQTFEPRPKHVLRAGRVAIDRAHKITALLDKPLQILDVGSGGGEFAYLLKTLGHTVTGVEPNRGYAGYSEREYGLAVQRGFIGDVSLPDSAYDLITVWHVLEHTESPRDVLAQLRRALRPEGRLVVEVPNLEATCQSPRSSFHEAHLYTFNPATLGAMARRAGFSLQSLALSDDGGNLTAVFTVSQPTPTNEIDGNHERVSRIVSSHTPARHLFTRHPYVRLARRLGRAVDERLALRKGLSGRALLDALYAPHRQRVAPAPCTGRPARLQPSRP
jgi:SAM-dependent methyltransferase